MTVPETQPPLSSTSSDILLQSYSYGTSPLNPDSLTTPHETFLYGYPIAHSLAPLFHSTLLSSLSIPWSYVLHETPTPDQFLTHLHATSTIGCAVTMPFKVTLSSAVDHLTEEARMIGAINTVFLRRSPLTQRPLYIGTNTDCVGVREAITQNHPDILSACAGKPALVIGGGGAARSAIYALWKWLKVGKIYVVNRIREEVEAIVEGFAREGCTAELVWVGSVEEAEAAELPWVVVGTVPDFEPREEGERRARRVVEVFLRKGKGGEGGERGEKGVVLEMCYHPRIRTRFFEMAEAEGWRVVPGTESMIYQGVAQQVLWTELPQKRIELGLGKVKEVIGEALKNH